jgi:hypothetical protein
MGWDSCFGDFNLKAERWPALYLALPVAHKAGKMALA